MRVIHGEVMDVAVDCRLTRRHVARMYRFAYHLRINANFGYQRDLRTVFKSSVNYCILSYFVTSQYSPSDEVTINCYDKDLGIGWTNVGKTLLSEKDRSGIAFATHMKIVS